MVLGIITLRLTEEYADQFTRVTTWLTDDYGAGSQEALGGHDGKEKRGNSRNCSLAPHIAQDCKSGGRLIILTLSTSVIYKSRFRPRFGKIYADK